MRIAFFDEPMAGDPALFGGKAASLGRLASMCQVPPGFSLSVDAYRAWQDDGADRMPGALEAEICDAYATLEQKCGVDRVSVAVRSSAVDEDGSGDSFAGLHDTYLNIVGADAVVEAVIRCWRSLKNEHALEYRATKGLDADSALMGVVVQQLVNADASAVAFSANPITGDLSEILVNANYGLGEAVVSGATTPDTIVVSKGDFSSQALTVGSKEIMTVRIEGGTREKSVPRVMRDLPVLSPEQVIEIASLVKRLEDENGFPVDLECAINGSDLYLLQCRPITTL